MVYNCHIDGNGDSCIAGGCVGICCIASGASEPKDSHCTDIDDEPAGLGPGITELGQRDEAYVRDSEFPNEKRGNTNKFFTWQRL